MDNFPQHTQLQTIEKGLDKQVECIFLVKGTSQYSQPCDSYPFASMRKRINKLGSIKMGKIFEGEKLNPPIRDIVPKAMALSFQPNLIKEAFL